MKYSQAILVACIGGAALVSAVPTPAKNAAPKRAAPKYPAKKPTAQRTGKTLGKLITHGGTFAQAATGNSDLQRRARTPKKGKIVSSIKRVGTATVRGAGGGTAVAENLGHIANFANNLRQSSGGVQRRGQTSSTPVSGRDFDEDLFARAVEEELAARDFFEEEFEAREFVDDELAARELVEEEFEARDYIDEDELALRDFEDDLVARGKYGKALGFVKSKVRKGGSKLRKGGVPSIPSTPSTDSSNPQRRDFEDELALRDLEELFESRDFEDDLVARGKLGKAFRFVKSKVSKGGAPSIPSTPSTDSSDPGPQRRDFEDELALRDLEELFESRDFEDDLVARGKLGKAFRFVKSKISKGGAPSIPSTPSMDSSDPQRRDFEDELLYSREFSEFSFNELD